MGKQESLKKEKLPTLICPEATALLGLIVGDDLTVKQTEDGSWVDLETTYRGYFISTHVRRCDPYRGGAWWHIDSMGRYFMVPNFENFKEVKSWIDEGLPFRIALGDIENVEIEENFIKYFGWNCLEAFEETESYLAEKKNLSESDKELLKKIIEIRPQIQKVISNQEENDRENEIKKNKGQLSFF